MSVLHLCFDIEIAVLYEILFSAQKKKRERERKKLKRHSKLPRSNYVNSCHITSLILSNFVSITEYILSRSYIMCHCEIKTFNFL